MKWDLLANATGGKEDETSWQICIHGGMKCEYMTATIQLEDIS